MIFCGELLSLSDSRACFTKKFPETLTKTHSAGVVFLINRYIKNSLNFQLKNYCNYSIFIRFSKIPSDGNKSTNITLSAKIGELIISCYKTA